MFFVIKFKVQFPKLIMYVHDSECIDKVYVLNLIININNVLR